MPIIVSIGGRRSEEFQEVARRCRPRAGHGGGARDQHLLPKREGRGIRSARCRAPRGRGDRRGARRLFAPSWAKLAPTSPRSGTLARACEEAGADGLTAVNTFVALAVDVRTRKPIIPGGTGGLSGPAIRPLALAKARAKRCVHPSCR
ncbi:MAG: hypothetical protein U0527_13050 [Candidatus Eisenbacteria bacterium]